METSTTTLPLPQLLVRARENCLLGYYEEGLADFSKALSDVQARSKSCSNEALQRELDQFYHELQYEYTEALEYDRALGELKRIGDTLKATREKDKRRRLEQEQVEEDEIRQKEWERAKSMRPTHMHKEPISSRYDKQEPFARPPPAPNSFCRRPNRSSNTRKAPSSSRRPQQKSKSTSRSSKSRKSLLDYVRSPPKTTSGELVRGRTKYSDIAREEDWADQELIDSIEREIVDISADTSFEDIAGLASSKHLLQETVMLPQIAPHLFSDGLLKPCSGILMFGPPGTGKTLLAKAVAKECDATFFNVSASTLSSKYHGDSEKLVRILFEMARYYAPSIVFMDEIDAIAGARGTSKEHEASRRVKTELLVQLSGMGSGESGRVMLLAATNMPWDLDEAMRRRLTKRVYIPLPDAEARKALFELNLKKVELGEVDIDSLVEQTEGYSGDDIASVCETAKRMPVKRVYTPDLLSEFLQKRGNESEAPDLQQLEKKQLIVTHNDFQEALSNVNKSVSHRHMERFDKWEQEFGSK